MVDPWVSRDLYSALIIAHSTTRFFCTAKTNREGTQYPNKTRVAVKTTKIADTHEATQKSKSCLMCLSHKILGHTVATQKNTTLNLELSRLFCCVFSLKKWPSCLGFFFLQNNTQKLKHHNRCAVTSVSGEATQQHTMQISLLFRVLLFRTSFVAFLG